MFVLYVSVFMSVHSHVSMHVRRTCVSTSARACVSEHVPAKQCIACVCLFCGVCVCVCVLRFDGFVCVSVCVCVFEGFHVGQGVIVSKHVRPFPVCLGHADHSPATFNTAVFPATTSSQLLANAPSSCWPSIGPADARSLL